MYKDIPLNNNIIELKLDQKFNWVIICYVSSLVFEKFSLKFMSAFLK